MNAHSSISASTIRAYEETEYRVLGDLPMTLIIGVRNAQLDDLHRAHDVDCSAFVTAANPLSEQTDEADNLSHQAKLADDLTLGHFEFIDGAGQHPSGDWPGEPSFLVLAGCSKRTGRALQAKRNRLVRRRRCASTHPSTVNRRRALEASRPSIDHDPAYRLQKLTGPTHVSWLEPPTLAIRDELALVPAATPPYALAPSFFCATSFE